MTRFETRHRVAFSGRQMYDLVADVEKYPLFLPLCEALVVRKRTTEGSMTMITADMTVGYKAIRETFTSRVTLEPDAMRIVARADDGPFRHLENRWDFREVAQGACDIDFFVAYEFKSMMLQILMGAMFEHAVRRFTEAFEARAKVVYGSGRSVA
jgi:coenzyme Q-binding protein COQ10